MPTSRPSRPQPKWPWRMTHFWARAGLERRTGMTMLTPPPKAERDLVLIGGGHTHALILKQFGMHPVPGLVITVIAPQPIATYSGMLPGLIAGHYQSSDLEIDLVRLCAFAGARLILAAATRVDPLAKLVHVAERPPVPYDVASVNIGLRARDLPGSDTHPGYLGAKPFESLMAGWQGFLDSAPAAPRLAVIGAGLAGIELALAAQNALLTRGAAPDITVFDRGRALDDLPDTTRKMVLAELIRAGITLVENTEIDTITATGLRGADGIDHAAEVVLNAGAMRAYGLAKTSFIADENGFIPVLNTLQHVDHPDLFAAGDCATFTPRPLPKSGVFAVRQAPILAHNVVARLLAQPATGGETPPTTRARKATKLRPYRPQKSYLKLVSLGRKRAFALRGHMALGGILTRPPRKGLPDPLNGRAAQDLPPLGLSKLIWRWKDRIDRRFIAMLNDVAINPAPPAQNGLIAPDDLPLCGGCAAKAAALALNAGLRAQDADTPLTADLGDDTARLTLGGADLVQSIDHLRGFWGDPYMMSKIAAHHALGDLQAGRSPAKGALINLVLPPLSARLQARVIADSLAGARAALAPAGVTITGGHTGMGFEFSVGFALTGLASTRQTEPLKAGDAIVMTRPLGVGVIMAAAMQARAPGRCVAAAINVMQGDQSEIAARLADEAKAITDVTGFGLGGHLLGLLRRQADGQRFGASLDVHKINTLDGALDLLDQGHRSSLHRDNLAAFAPDVIGFRTGHAPHEVLLDPQTCGGFLAIVDADVAPDLCRALTEFGATAVQIGRLTPLVGDQVTITIAPD